MDNKKEIVNSFIEACELKLDFKEKIEICVQVSGVLISLCCLFDDFYIKNNTLIIENNESNVSINIKEYKIDLLEKEEITTLQFKNESNEIRISI